jgi:hypothetical protein
MLVSELRPGFGCEVWNLPVGGMRQAGEDVVQVSVRIESATTARFDDSVQDGVFDQVVVDLDASVFEVNAEQGPIVQDVLQSQAHAAAGQVTPLHFEASQGTMKPLVNGAGLMSTDGGPQSWTTLICPREVIPSTSPVVDVIDFLFYDICHPFNQWC